jgi:hypothetical protein
VLAQLSSTCGAQKHCRASGQYLGNEVLHSQDKQEHAVTVTVTCKRRAKWTVHVVDFHFYSGSA